MHRGTSRPNCGCRVPSCIRACKQKMGAEESMAIDTVFPISAPSLREMINVLSRKKRTAETDKFITRLIQERSRIRKWGRLQRELIRTSDRVRLRRLRADIALEEKLLNKSDSSWRKRAEAVEETGKTRRARIKKAPSVPKGRVRTRFFISEPLDGIMPSFLLYTNRVIAAIEDGRPLSSHRDMAARLGFSRFHRQLEEYQKLSTEYWRRYNDPATPDTVLTRLDRKIVDVKKRAGPTTFQACLLRHVDRAGQLTAAITRRQWEDASDELDQNEDACYDEALKLDLSVK